MRKGSVIGNNLIKNLLAVIDQIHLVYGENDVFDADEVAQIAVPPRLYQYTFARVDHHDGKIRG